MKVKILVLREVTALGITAVEASPKGRALLQAGLAACLAAAPRFNLRELILLGTMVSSPATGRRVAAANRCSARTIIAETYVAFAVNNDTACDLTKNPQVNISPSFPAKRIRNLPLPRSAHP